MLCNHSAVSSCVGADRQAQQDSHIEIHQLYTSNRANSRFINNNEARKLWNVAR